MSHYCPSCGAGLASEPVGAPLCCKNCRWHLVTLAEWGTFSPFQKGYVHYMQASWPTSELAKVSNPYQKGTPDYLEFCHGERRAMTDAQDGEE